MSNERPVPPLPGKKPPVPLDFQITQFLKGFGSMGLPGGLPPLSLQGGDAGPATSGGIGEQGNIGPVNFGTNNFKSSSWLSYLVIGGVILAGLMIWKKK